MHTYIKTAVSILFAFCMGCLQAQTVTEMQWWFDDDVQHISSSPHFAHDIPTSALSEGMHTLHLRVKDSEGNFSPVSSSWFLKLNRLATHSRPVVECWFDNDVAQLQTIDVAPGGWAKVSLSTATIGEGLHSLNYRVAYSGGGVKSGVSSNLFLKLNHAATTNARVLEYWFDDDYASRLQAPVAEGNDLIVLDLNTDNLSVGGHLVSFRYGYDGGVFSDVSKAMFVKGNNPYVLNESQDLFVSGYSYTFDNDTTFVVAYLDSLPDRTLTSNLDVSFLAPGVPHAINIRFHRNDGAQSMPLRYTFNAGDSMSGNDSDTLVYYASVCRGDSYTVNGFNIANATVSHTYFTNRTINGIDRMAQLNLTVFQPLGNSVSGMLPAPGGTATATPVAFAWHPVENASNYDFYLWRADSVCPSQPTQTSIAFYRFEQTEGLEYGNDYCWKIVAKNNCSQWESPVFTFTLRQVPNLRLSELMASEVDSVTRRFTVNYTVRNDGLGATIEPFWIDRLWLVPDIANSAGTRQAGTMLLFNDTCLQALGSGESYSREIELTLPGRWHGNYWLIAATDMNDVSSIDWTHAGGVPLETYQPDASGTPYPYLFAGATNGKRVFELDETAARSDNFFYRKLPVPQPPRKPFIYVSKDTIDFGARTVLLPDSVTINITLQDLLSPVHITLSGDTDAFSITPATNYTDSTGGSLKVRFSPVALRPYEALLTLASDTTVARVVLKGASESPTLYNVSAEVTSEVYSSSDSMLISGQAIYNNGTVASNVPVRVVVSVMGYNRNFADTTDIDGHYSVLFKPQANESGHYTVRAFNPSRVENTVKEEFDIPGFKLNDPYVRLEVEKDIPQTGTILFANRSNIPLHDIRFEVVEGLPHAGISIENIATLPASGASLAVYQANGTALTTSNQWEEIKLRGTSSEGIVYHFSIWFYCKPARGIIQATPNALHALMTKGASKLAEFQIRNNGNGETGSIEIALPDVDYMTLASPETMPSIAPNDSAKLSVWLSPTENTPLNTPMSGNIAVNCSNGSGAAIPFTVEAVSDSTGTLTIDVIDEYYYNTTAAPHLANARVVVAHPYSFAIIAEGFTDAQGLFTVNDIPEGYYTVFVEAEKHSSYRNNIKVEAGTTLTKQVFVSFDAVSYSWTVTPTEVEDRYEITLNTTFETNVPAPVIQIIMPDEIPLLEGEEEYRFDFKLRNLGLIAAHNVSPQFPDDPVYLFIPLVDKLDTLAAGATQVIPVTVIRKDAIALRHRFAPYYAKTLTRSSSGEKCVDVAGTHYQYYCGKESNWKFVWRTVEYKGRKCETEETQSTLEQIIEEVRHIADQWSDNAPRQDDNEYNGGGSWGGIPLPSWINPSYSNPGGVMQTITDCHECDRRKCATSISSLLVGEELIKAINHLYDCSQYFKTQVTESGVDSDGGYFDEQGNWLRKKYLKNMYRSIKEIKSCTKTIVSVPGLVVDLLPTDSAYVDDDFSDVFDWNSVVKKGVEGVLIDNDLSGFLHAADKKIESLVRKHVPYINKLTNAIDIVADCGACLMDKMWNGSPRFMRAAGEDTATEYETNANRLQTVENYLLTRSSIELYLLGDIRIMAHPNIVACMDAAQNYVDLDLPIPFDDANLIASGMPDTLYVPFINRWNNTLEAWNSGIYNPQEYGYTNILSSTILEKYAHRLDSLETEAQSQGFESALEMATYVMQYLEDVVNDDPNTPSQGVCASVSLQLSQKMTMTREAFRGTLTLHNGHESLPMEAIDLRLEVKDANGALCNDLFYTGTEAVSGLLTAIDGTGTLAAQSDGTATTLFIPTINAAPSEIKTYFFGGKLSYLDPFGNDTVTVDLFPVKLEVHPSPNLHLYYFMQRDIVADDPLTENIEPSLAAHLGVMVQNKGYGTAKSLTIESVQPKIVDNKKGLAIQFEIIGSQLNGEQRNLGVTGIDFGNLEGRSVKTGQWWLTSNLLGHFTSYESRVRHLDSYGRPDLSLVDSVEIHELVRFITAYGDKDDGVLDFLVNDQTDAHDYPDAIYFSDATRTAVALADTAYTDGVVQPAIVEINLTIQSSQSGWHYARLDDPGRGAYQLVRVLREDNEEIPLTNVWQSYCTMPDNREPVYENKLHIVDMLSDKGFVNYTLYFEERTTKVLCIDSIKGILPEGAGGDTLKTLTVYFNKPVFEPTFTWQDMSLVLLPDNHLMDSTVTTARLNDSTYQICLGDKAAASGRYEFTVYTQGIYDVEQYPGAMNATISWSNLSNAVAPIFAEKGITIFPNPVSDELHIRSERPIEKIEIYDLVGRLKRTNNPQGNEAVNLSSLPAGVYVVRIYTGEGAIEQKLVKE